MRGGVAQASIFLLSILAPAISYALPTHQASTNAVSQDDSVLLWRDSDGVYVQFEASCASCSLDNKDWPVNLFIGSTNGLCDNATVSVNGQELSHRWEGQSATGSGVIPSSPYNGSTELRATWHSTCVTAPLGAPNGQNAHVFTFIFDTDRSDALEDDIGFTISFGNDTWNDDGIKVLRLSNFPVGFGDVPSWGEWDDTTDVTNPNSGSRLNPESVPLEAQLEAELQKLQVLQYEIQQLHNSVALQEKKILHLLKQDCKPLLAKWQQCEDFFCYLRSSWQKVPEFYWYIRYRFGLLGPGRVIPICRLVPEKPSDHDTNTNRPPALPSHPVPTPSKHAVPTHLGTLSTSSSTSTIAIPSTTTVPLRPITTPPSSKPDSHLDTNPNHSDITEVVLPLPIHSPTKEFFRSCAIILLIALIIALFFRVVRHSTAFRRRRRDIASRREELRAQRAYRNAARRLRWRQWWEGRSYFQAASVTSSHSLPEFHHVRGAANANDENNRLISRDISNNGSASEMSSQSPDPNDEEPRQRMMQAEILGLRRVLEYVGQLVGTDGTTTTSTPSSSARRRTRSRSRSVPPPYEQIMRHNRNRSVSGNHHAANNTLEIRRSATPGVISAASGGLSSPRASTMFSLETGSLVTLETLDTLDSGTAPPSYHP